MPIGSLAGVIPRLRHVALAPHGLTSDADLLDRFVASRDEVAFEVLVRRHGPMVFAACRRVLRHTQDAEDAFQATFLVLAHKAATVSPRSKLAGWLHGVAYKTALKARYRAARRAEVERNAPTRDVQPMSPETNWDDVEPLLDQELAGLPDRYRLPIILCDLEGRLRAEAAASLGCAEGTLSSRLTRGRRLLADRLKRRGIHLSGPAVALVLVERSVALAEPLIRSTVPAALSATSASAAAAGAVSPSVVDLAKGVMKSMFLKKLQTVAVAAFVVAATAAALTSVVTDRSHAAPVPKEPATPAADDKAVIESLSDVDGQLLMNRKVLKDMKCDIDQLDKVMDMLEAAQVKANEKTNEAMMQLKPNAAGGGFNPEAFQKMIQDAQEAGAKEYRKSVADAVTTILTPTQRKRLREIDLQVKGYEAFTTASVAKTLELTAKQKEEMAANAKKVDEDIMAAFQNPVAGGAVGGAVGGPAGPNGGVVIGRQPLRNFDYDKIVGDARAEGLKRALAILTDEQKAVWKKMTGAPFTHPIKHQWKGNFGRIGGGGFVPAPVPLPAPLPGGVVPALPAKPILPPGGAGGAGGAQILPAKPVIPPDGGN